MPSHTFNSVGWHEWVVPTDVNQVQIDLRGAGSLGRQGGRVIGLADVRPDQSIWILVGQAGQAASGDAGGLVASPGGGGHGGNGGKGRRGGDGGGGATAVRKNTQTGPVVAVAGGAGGRSGDGGLGGLGGSYTGGDGQKGGGDPGHFVDPPTGGTQSGPGQAGINRLAPPYSGNKGDNQIIGLGGRGGQQTGVSSSGGGGGGGGFYPGSGGTASMAQAPGTGGSGGSNYIGGMYNATTYRGEGQVNIGLAVFTWSVVPQVNLPPTPPTDVLIEGQPEVDDAITRKMSDVTITAEISDPNSRDIVRMLVRWSTDKNFVTYADTWSDWQGVGRAPFSVHLIALQPNTHYYAQLWSQDAAGVISTGYNAINFWTNRPPSAPELISPPENSTQPAETPVIFDWRPIDPDDPDPQRGFQFRFRRAATITVPAADWRVIDYSNTTESTVTVGTEPGQPGVWLWGGNQVIEWGIQTRDQAGVYGEWSLTSSFYALGSTVPPEPQHPFNEAVDVTRELRFEWRFIDPSPIDTQLKADIRYRLVGQGEGDWITVIGQEDVVNVPTQGHPPLDVNENVTDGIPGNDAVWVFPAFTFDPGYQYEWQVRTLDQNRDLSDWSYSLRFWTVALSAPPLDPIEGPVQGSLGCGVHRVFAYQQGGTVLIGEITPIAALTYSRTRDDIANCTITTNGFSFDCGEMLGNLHTWMHEIVVFRDGKRVWEGPITRIAYSVGSVEIEAKDVMGYVYRRIMRQGYNDSYRIVRGIQYGLTTVVDRAAQIIMNAMVPWDANILPYLTPLRLAGDARQSRVVPDYAKTAWEEVDDLAQNAGLDYTTVGRRIILWDTHRPIGRLPEMRDKDFSDPPIVTEYGMQLANYYAVTNNQGVWGATRRREGYEPYGPIELLASSYGESDAGATDTLTPEAYRQLVEVLTAQAERGMHDRWPTPVVVRVPDNAAVSVDAPVTLDQLVPGVWIPVRATGTVREVTQWQKLDSVTVGVGPTGESVRVVMSPAPNAGQDPDAGDNPDTPPEDEEESG